MTWSHFYRILTAVLAYSIVSTSALAQEHFYYSFNGKKIPLTISSEKISIKFKSDVTPEHIHRFFSTEPVLGDTLFLPSAATRGLMTVQLKTHTNVMQLVQRLERRSEIAMVNPVFFSHDSLERIPYDHFVVKFKMSVTQDEIESLNNRNHVEIVRVSGVENNRYTLKITTESDLSILKMSNLYYESLPAEWSLPDFFSQIELHIYPNDPYFLNQYYFHNTGQTGGVSDADINTPSAWNISKGSSNITVAVLDAGVAAHEDLPASRIVPGHD